MPQKDPHLLEKASLHLDWSLTPPAAWPPALVCLSDWDCPFQNKTDDKEQSMTETGSRSTSLLFPSLHDLLFAQRRRLMWCLAFILSPKWWLFSIP